MTLIRSLLFNLFFYVWSLSLAIVFLPVVLMPVRHAQSVSRLWAGTSFLMLRFICGITYRVEGAEHRLPGPVIYASKHQSAWETLGFWLLIDNPIFVLKRELLWLPVFGLHLKHVGSIAIDRSGKTAAIRDLVKGGKRAMKDGYPIVIFPEGTRSQPGDKKPYSPGVAALYSQLNVPVVPVALNSGLCWSRNAFVKKPGVITVRFLPSIPPGLQGREFLNRLEEMVEKNTRELEAEA